MIFTLLLNVIPAPPGYTIEHAHRPSAAGRPSRGGGIAIVFRDHYKTRSINLRLQPTAFELQSLVFSSTTPPTLLLNIYQPRSPPTSVFFDELSMLLANAVVESSARLIVCGDFNCPGIDGRISEKLDDVLVSYGLHQLVEKPTRGGNLLNIVAVSNPATISHIRVIDSAAMSDHNLIVATLQSRRPPPPVIQFASQPSGSTTPSLRPESATLYCSRLLLAPLTGLLPSFSPS